MRKFMFNDRCGLTTSVIQKTKWKTRRIASGVVRKWYVVEELSVFLENPTKRERALKEFALKTCPIKVGEIIAVAQSYKDCGYEKRHDASGSERILIDDSHHPYIRWHNIPMSAAWGNKMFAKAEYMPFRIKITGVDFERLQDISYEDCLAEGIYKCHDVINSDKEKVKCFTFPNTPHIYATPRDAFAALIDKVSGNGTWESNPYVYVFTFELV